MKRLHRNHITATALLLILVAAGSACTNRKGNSSQGISAEAALIAPSFKSGKFQDSEGNVLPYRFFEPAVADSGTVKYPVILYLHGETESGTDNQSQLVKTECATIWAEPDHLEKNPVYIVAPQAPEGTDWTREPLYSNTLGLLKEFIADHPGVDPERIYIVGFSMGGTGVWNMILRNPELFAAAMPISGNADNFLGNDEAFRKIRNLPVLVIHSIDDPVSPVSGSNNAIDAMKAAGSSSAGSNTSIWGLGSVKPAHDAWQPAFHHYEVIYNWLFEQSLARTEHGMISPDALFTTHEVGNGIKVVWDYSLGTAYVLEGSDKAVIIDAGAGNGSIYEYIKNNVLVNRDIDIDILVTHNHFDHIVGLSSFVGAAQLKHVYVHKEDSEAVIRLMGPDAGKVNFVGDGDMIPFNGENIKVIHVPGHSWGSVVFRYHDDLFTGDAIGSGDVWLGGAVMSIEEYITSVQHLLDEIGDTKVNVYGGHLGENRSPLNQEYVFQMMACARGLVDGTIESVPYRRTIGGQPTLGYDATYGRATIVHNLNNIHKIPGALRSLTVSSGTLTPRYVPYTVYYSATVDENTKSVLVTADVLADDFKSITINGEPAESEVPHEVMLKAGDNRIAIEVVTTDNKGKIYTLNVYRGSRSRFMGF